MKHLLIAATFVALGVHPAFAQDKVVEKTVVKKVIGAGNGAEDPATAKIVADCSARKFETSAELEKDGKKRVTKIKLCSTKSGDDMAWVKTLEDAKTKIGGHPDISAESKAKIEAELTAEISRLHKAMGH